VAAVPLKKGSDASGARTLAAWSGNVGLSYLVSDALIPYANVASSFETPTPTELANRPDGSGGFNDSLGPQRAWTYEIGVRGRIGALVEYSVAGFLGRVRDAIVQFQEVGGRAFFRNAGRTHNDGVEVGISVEPSPRLRVFGSYTFADYTFAEYADVTGNRLPGV